LFISALAFAYAGGWLTPGRLIPTRMVAALSDRDGNPLGHRRNHSKGICFIGVFEANGAASQYSVAPMLVAGRYPVVGRFAIAVGNPDASDVMGRVKSMAVRIVSPNGQEWRSVTVSGGRPLTTAQYGRAHWQKQEYSSVALSAVRVSIMGAP
jgi:catalase